MVKNYHFFRNLDDHKRKFKDFSGFEYVGEERRAFRDLEKSYVRFSIISVKCKESKKLFSLKVWENFKEWNSVMKKYCKDSQVIKEDNEKERIICPISGVCSFKEIEEDILIDME
jgi:hypothetical protein